jgi:DNA-directed RNA polymerase specialized sigma24 family protein
MTSRDTAAFPDTRHSILRAVASGEPEARHAALGVLAAIYWRPVYTRFRLKWHLGPADAEDLAQDFFIEAMAGSMFERYDPARARFRAFLRVCADRFAANAHRGRQRLKRGGGATLISADIPGLERELASASAFASGAEADAWFDRDWVRVLFADAVAHLRADTAGTPREIRFTLLRRYDLDPARDADRPGYRDLALEYGLSLVQVTNHLAWARARLRGLLLERIRLLSGSDAEFRAEAVELLGLEPE